MKAANFDGEKIFFDKNYTNPSSNNNINTSEETLVRVSLAGICGTDLENSKWIYAVSWSFGS